MIIYNKNIQKWAFWRKKSKFTFCIASGLFYAILVFVGNIVFRYFFGNSENIIENSLSVAIGGFIAVSFLSIALWFENERRYKKWKKGEETAKKVDH